MCANTSTLRQSAHRLLWFSLCAVMLVNTGCSVVDRKKATRFGYQGQPMTEEFLDLLKPGKTSRTWLLEHVGDPTSIESLGHNCDLLTYRFEETEMNRTRVLMLYRQYSETVTEKNIYFKVEDGIVTEYWKDYDLPSAPWWKLQESQQQASQKQQPPKIVSSNAAKPTAPVAPMTKVMDAAPGSLSPGAKGKGREQKKPLPESEVPWYIRLNPFSRKAEAMQRQSMDAQHSGAAEQ